MLLDELQLPIPDHVKSARATLDRLAELDVVRRPVLTRNVLAAQLRGRVGRGEDVDPVELVRLNREGVDSIEADAVVEEARKDAEHLLQLAIRSTVRETLPATAAAIEKVYWEVRTLPAGTPTTAADAVHGSPEAIKGYRALEALAGRHWRLRALHRELISTAESVAVVLFGDTRSAPAVMPTTRLRGEAAGPRDPVARLRWLADPENQAWVPTASEVSTHYFDHLRQLREPVKAAEVAHLAT